MTNPRTSPGAARRLAEQPALWHLDGFLDDARIDALLALFGDEDFVRGQADTCSWDAAGFCAEIAADRHPLLADVARRIEAAVGLCSSLPARLRMRYYATDQAHPPHLDEYTQDGSTLAVSVLVTLIAPEAGGETRFLDARPAPVDVLPCRGRLVAWTNTRPGGAPDPASRHEGVAVRAGAKAVLLAFLYQPDDGVHGVLTMVQHAQDDVPGDAPA